MKKSNSGNRKRPYRKWLDAKEVDLVNQYRAIQEHAEHAGVNPEDVKHGWLKTDEASLFFRNPDFKEDDQTERVREELLAELKDYAPKYPKIKRTPCKDGHLLVLDPADVHIGKLCSSLEAGTEYNSQIAVQRVREGVQGILNKSKGWNIDKIVLVGGNDILHVDTPRRTTTSGTPQDTDGMWYENFVDAKRIYVEIIETLLSIADVHFVYNPSNHDYMSGFFLSQVIEAHFSKSKNITFDVSITHRKYFKYGLNLIGTTHGDGAKTADLPLLMAQESKDWTDCKHRYIYTHHVHHKSAKDFGSVCVESLRSPSGTDSWHHRNGYQHAPKAIEGYIHHKDFGQIARLTNIF